jgi:hypothetical protein
VITVTSTTANDSDSTSRESKLAPWLSSFPFSYSWLFIIWAKISTIVILQNLISRTRPFLLLFLSKNYENDLLSCFENKLLVPQIDLNF